ncbi:MAG: hypothetical protein N3D15_00915 [Syntrophorhabdaceae bacterium]|nr:hypothetical protein [Syntrophorhabdaceae bacterium]
MFKVQCPGLKDKLGFLKNQRKIWIFLFCFFLSFFYLSPLTLYPLLSHCYTSEWKQAIGKWVWEFPRDHGSHPEYKTEWWYFTGNLLDEKGKRYGYQLTFFRHSLKKSPEKTDKNQKSPWTVDDIYLGHFAITDIQNKKFWFTERTSRRGPGLAYAATDRMDIRLLNWNAIMKKNNIFIKARHQDMEIDFELTPIKNIVLHGADGLSMKGERQGQASYYYSLTRLETKGIIKTPLSNKAFKVKGLSWFDHEFGSNQLSPQQEGWDWFSLHLSDGRDLMIYILRKKDGTVEDASSGTLVEKDGSSRHLIRPFINIQILDRWQSTRSKGIYPNGWRIQIPSAQIDLTIYPLLAEQELITDSSTRIIYWEGAVEGKGTSKNRPITATGYIELTGYAGSLGGIF